VHTGIGRTGVVGVVRGRKDGSGRSIGLRADMDALPLAEENEFGHKSIKSGLMHACGHDGHTTMLLGAAQYLAATRNFDGTVFLIFQPGEEGYAGAREMIQDGLFERFPADEVYALHTWPALPSGHIGLNPGPMMAAADQVRITLSGKGGHGAHPHLTVDPVLMAGQIISAAQSIVARNVAPIEAAVLSLCAVQAGSLDAFSVVPREARISGTVRTFSESVQQTIEARLRELVESTARALGGRGEVDYKRMYPATINHLPQFEFAAGVAEAVAEAAAAAPVDLRAGSAARSRSAFIASGVLPNVTDGRQPRRCSDDLPTLSAAVDLGAVDSAGASHLVLMAYDDVRSVEYFGTRV
jgi:hippurate hydrolase